MTIAIGGFHTPTRIVEKDHRGHDNRALAYFFGGYAYSIEDLWDVNCDVALIVGISKSLRFLKEKGKSPKWKKAIFLEESGIELLYNSDYMTLLCEANYKVKFDGYGLHTPRLKEVISRIPIKPLVHRLPYPFEYFEKNRLEPVQKNWQDIVVNFGRVKHNEGGIIAASSVLKALPKNYNFVAYMQEQDELYIRKLLHYFGVGGRVKIKNWIGNFKNYVNDIKQYGLFLNMETRMTVGRFAADAAANKSICVGTYSAFQDELFSKYMVDHYQIFKARDLLINNVSSKNEFLISNEIKEKYKYENVRNHWISEASKLF